MTRHGIGFSLLLFMVALSAACSRGASDLRCDTSAAISDVLDFVARHSVYDGPSSVEIQQVMATCPGDLPLARVLANAYLREGHCEQAWHTHEVHRRMGAMQLFPLSEHEHVFFCFYGIEAYGDATRFYREQMSGKPLPSLMAREAYAQSLFAQGDAPGAIDVLRHIVAEDHSSRPDQHDVASYEVALLSLAQMLYFNDQAEAAIPVATRYLSLQPHDGHGHEVLVAAAVKAGNLPVSRMHSIYCDALRWQDSIETMSRDPEGARNDFLAMQELIASQGSSLECTEYDGLK